MGPSDPLRPCSTIPRLPLLHASRPAPSENLLSIIWKQNELTSTLVQSLAENALEDQDVHQQLPPKNPECSRVQDGCLFVWVMSSLSWANYALWKCATACLGQQVIDTIL